jgi:two-component system chemotaxis response regulator CheY
MGGDRSMTTILYVEDNPEHRLMMHTLLTSQGFDVEIARNGIEGMEIIREIPPDLILTDLYMPKMDGFGFIEHIKNNPITQDIPIIVVSAWPTGDHRQRAFECGALVFVAKPYDTDALVDLIKENLPVHA